MSIERQGGRPSERRQFFRIDDSVQMSYRVVQQGDLQEQMGELGQHVDSSFTVMTRMQAIDRHLSAALHRIELRDPDVADYLRALDEKIEFRITSYNVCYTKLLRSLGDFLGSFAIGMKAFFYKTDDPKKLIEEAVQLADVARKNGLLALEGQEISNDFLKQGIGLCVDGHDPSLVSKLLSKDIELTIQRHEVGQTMFTNMAIMAPAMGMIGTLIGLVQMLANMSDPASIGPAMAVALLTTLYGAVIANAFAQPIADKLARASAMEKTNKSLIIETISGIQEGMNPRVLEQLLSTYLPSSKRPSGDK